MATHDYNLANQDGASFRSDLNNALAAIVSNNSSSTSPATTFAHQIWVDTTANVIKQRNAANDAWIELWRIDGGFNAKTFSSNVTLNAQSDLRFADSDSSNWVAFQAPATVSSNVTWTLPAADGTSGQVIETNGSGVLSWADAGGVTDNITEGNTSAEVVDTGSDGHFKVVTEGTEGLRVDASQRLLAGTTSQTKASRLVVQGHSTDGTAHGIFRINRGSTNPSSGTDIGEINFQDSAENVAALIACQSDGTWGSNDYPGRLVFSTTADGNSSPTARMTIKESGNVGIGTTGPGALLDVRGANTGLAKIRLNETDNFQAALQLRGNDLEIRGSSGTIEFYRGNADEASSTEVAQFDSSNNFRFNSGYGSVATAYGVRAWVCFNGNNGTVLEDGNVSSVTDNGTGNYTINFAIGMPDSNYAATGSSDSSGAGDGVVFGPPATGSIQMDVFDQNGTLRDHDKVFVIIVR